MAQEAVSAKAPPKAFKSFQWWKQEGGCRWCGHEGREAGYVICPNCHNNQGWIGQLSLGAFFTLITVFASAVGALVAFYQAGQATLQKYEVEEAVQQAQEALQKTNETILNQKTLFFISALRGAASRIEGIEGSLDNLSGLIFAIKGAGLAPRRSLGGVEIYMLAQLSGRIASERSSFLGALTPPVPLEPVTERERLRYVDRYSRVCNRFRKLAASVEKFGKRNPVTGYDAFIDCNAPETLDDSSGNVE